jgi:lipopolysaccharide export system protein LptA
MKHVALLLALVVFASPVTHARKDDADQPVNVRARRVDANEKTGVTTYQGNVVLTQGSLRLDADRMEVTTRDGRLRRVRAWGGPVRFRNRTDSGEEIRGEAGRVEYFASERRIDLHQRVKLTRNNDSVEGAVVRYDLERATFSAEGGDDGQVSAVIQPAKKGEPQ